jgi:hypothetical protein
MHWCKGKTVFMLVKGAGIFYRTGSVLNRYARLLGPLAGFLMFSSASAQQTDPAPDPLQPQYTENGAEKCLLCHAETRMTLIATTPHGSKTNPNTSFAQHGCETCHGKGSLHVSRSMRGKGRPPMIAFGEGKHTPLAEQAFAFRIFWAA